MTLKNFEIKKTTTKFASSPVSSNSDKKTGLAQLFGQIGRGKVSGEIKRMVDRYNLHTLGKEGIGFEQGQKIYELEYNCI